MGLEVYPTGDRQLIAAMEDNYLDLMRCMHRWPGIETFDGGRYWQSISQEPVYFLNSISRIRLTTADVDEKIATAINRCRERRVPTMCWLLPRDTPAGLDRALERYGMRLVTTDPGMVKELADYEPTGAPPPRFHWRRVLDRQSLQTYANIMTTGFGMADSAGQTMCRVFMSMGLEVDNSTEHYLGFWGETPVASGALHFHEDSAGIYNVATLQQARRKGIGKAMCAGLMQRAKQRGSRLACLQSSVDGYELYLGLGFRTVCQVPIYVWDPDSSPSTSRSNPTG